MLADAAAYGGLFLAAFLAATILPLQSEAALAGLVLAGHQPATLLLLGAQVIAEYENIGMEEASQPRVTMRTEGG